MGEQKFPTYENIRRAKARKIFALEHNQNKRDKSTASIILSVAQQSDRHLNTKSLHILGYL